MPRGRGLAPKRFFPIYAKNLNWFFLFGKRPKISNLEQNHPPGDTNSNQTGQTSYDSQNPWDGQIRSQNMEPFLWLSEASKDLLESLVPGLIENMPL